MEKRKLGKSGIEVSVVGLGCNNFGAMTVDASRARGRQGDRARHHPVRHRRRLRQSRRLGDAARRDPRLPAQGHRPCHQIRHADGRRRHQVRRLGCLYPRGLRRQPEAPQDRLDRPLPAASARPEDADRGDAARPRRSGEAGQGARHRLLQHAGRPAGGGAGHLARRTTWPPMSRPRTNTASLVRGVETALVPTLEKRGHGPFALFPARQRPAHRQVRDRARTSRPAPAMRAWAASASAT